MTFWERRPLRRNAAGIVIVLLLWVPIGPYVELAGKSVGLVGMWEKAAWYILLLLVIILVTRLFDRKPLIWAGIGTHRWMGRELLQGTALGGAMATLVWLPFLLSGGADAGTPGSNFLVQTGYLVMSAAGEEILFRGYLFQRMVEIAGPLVATVLLSALFAFAHLANPEMTTFSGVNIFLGGIFFSLCYLRTGSLWLPFAAHFAWNFTLAKILGLTVSGQTFGGSLLATRDILPDWLGGGGFGPEGGVIATIGLVAGTIALLTIPQITYSPYVYAERFWGEVESGRLEVEESRSRGV
jgi:membrane protease YdiL (CAAX protease family)